MKHVKLVPRGEELEKLWKEKPDLTSMALPWLSFAEILANAYIDVKKQKETKET